MVDSKESHEAAARCLKTFLSGFECQEYQEKEPELAAQFKRAVIDRKLPENWCDALPKAQVLLQGLNLPSISLLRPLVSFHSLKNSNASALWAGYPRGQGQGNSPPLSGENQTCRTTGPDVDILNLKL